MTETVNTVSGELAVIEDATAQSVDSLAGKLASLKSGNAGGVLSTLTGTDHKTKIATLSAINNSVPLADNLGKTITVANIIVQPLEMEDEATKQMLAVPRVILIQPDGKAFHAISGVLFRDVQDWFGILGHPSEWEEPLSVKVVQEGTGNRKYFTAKVV